MGREVSCYHCSARFPADCSSTPTQHPYVADIIARADALLENYSMVSFDSSPSK